MKRYLAVVVATAAFAGAGVGSQAQEVSCDGPFPIYDNTAVTEQENEDRIACVNERRQVIQDRIAERKANRQDITHRIEQLRQRKQAISHRIDRDRQRAKPLGQVIDLLSYIRGEVSWVWTTSTCESGNNPEAHSPSGTYHGMGQFALHWGNDLQWFVRYGGGDPHTHAAIVQAAAMVELKRAAGDEQWPVCGD